MTTPFRNTETRAFAFALLRAALERLEAGEATFTTDIVPDAARGAGRGTAGSVVEALKTEGVIHCAGIWHQGEFYQARVKSSRPCANGRHICVLRLHSREMAEQFLKANETTEMAESDAAKTIQPQAGHRVSACCGDYMTVAGSAEGTRWHECKKCGSPCDAVVR